MLNKQRVFVSYFTKSVQVTPVYINVRMFPLSAHMEDLHTFHLRIRFCNVEIKAEVIDYFANVKTSFENVYNRFYLGKQVFNFNFNEN